MISSNHVLLTYYKLIRTLRYLYYYYSYNVRFVLGPSWRIMTSVNEHGSMFAPATSTPCTPYGRLSSPKNLSMLGRTARIFVYTRHTVDAGCFHYKKVHLRNYYNFNVQHCRSHLRHNILCTQRRGWIYKWWKCMVCQYGQWKRTNNDQRPDDRIVSMLTNSTRY